MMFATGGSLRPFLRQTAVVSQRGRRRRRAGWLAVAVALAVLSTAAVSSPAAAQAADGSDVVRIVARKLASGRIEFGLQQRQADESWGDRRLPRVRFFPTTAGVGRWLASSALSLPAGEVRIVARKLASGRVEFGLQQRQADESWGDRRLPRVRFFPTTAGVGRWLASSALTVRPGVEAEPRPEPVVEPEPQPQPEPEPQPDREPQPEPEGASAGADVVGEAPGARAEPLTGDLPVPVFICAPAGVFDSSDLRQVVAGLNTHVSPFYRWQSSGLVDLSFTEGSVIAPRARWDVVWPPGLPFRTVLEDYWEHEYYPPHCEPSSESQSGANGFLIYVYNVAGEATDFGGLTVSGRGYLDRPLSIVYIGDNYGTEGLNSDRYRFVAGHELDHSHLRVLHIPPPIGRGPGQSTGSTRAGFSHPLFDPNELFDLQSFLEEWEGRGLNTGSGIPQYFAVEGDRGNVPNGMSRVLTCYDRERLGWPVGEGTPPCVRIAPRPPRISLNSGNDRRLEIDIDSTNVFTDNATRRGYIIEVSEWTRPPSDSAGGELELVARYVVGPDTRRHLLDDTEIRKTYHLAVYPYSDYGISYRAYSTHNLIYEFTQKFPPVTVEVQDRSLTREQLLAGQPGSGPGEVRLEDGLQFRLSWTVPEGARSYQLNGFGKIRDTVDEQGRLSTTRLGIGFPEFLLDGAAHDLEFNTTYTISIGACGEFPGVSDGHGSCHDYAEVTLTTPSELPSAPYTPPEPPLYDDYDYPFRETYPFPPASPRIEDRSLTLQQLLQPSPGQSAEDVRHEDGLQYKLSWTAPANVFIYEFIGYGPYRFRMVEGGHVTAAWGGSRGSRVPELILDGREHQLEFDYTYNIIIRACFEIEDNDDNPHTHMVECHDFAEVSLTTRSSLSR